MWKTTPSFEAALQSVMILSVAWAGCAQVLDIQDWKAGSGGAGGEGGAWGTSTSANTSTGTSTGTSTTTTGTQSTTVTSSSSGGQGGNPGCDGVCIADPPAGWEGPVAVIMLQKDATLPDCTLEWPTLTDWKTGQLIAPVPNCGTCGCGLPTGGKCNLTQVNIGLYTDANCSATGSLTPVTSPNCTQLQLAGGTSFSANILGQSLPSNSSCAPSILGAPTIEPAYFEKVARFCGASTPESMCTDGRQCFLPPPSNYPSVCIYQTVPVGGSVMCPPGYNPAPDFYTGIMDSRGCGTCTCKPPNNQFCEMHAQIFGNLDCSSGGLLLSLNPGVCGSLSNGASGGSVLVAPGQPQGGQCQPLTPTAPPTGEVSGTERTAVCCL